MKIILITFTLLFFCILNVFVDAQAVYYNSSIAQDSVYMAQLAYCPSSSIKAWICPTCITRFPGVTNITTAALPQDAASGFVAYEPRKNRIHYAFAGTKNFPGWILDFTFTQIQFDPTSGCGSDCLVHEGMYLAYVDLAATLLPALQTLTVAYPTADILISSHSHGAGISVFAYADLLRKVVTKGRKLNYNFGCPRVSTPPFIKWLQTFLNESAHENFRVTNACDPIPRLAPRTYDYKGTIQHWLHDPREIYYLNRNGPLDAYKVCDGNYTTEDPTCADACPEILLNPIDHTTYLGVPLGGCPP
jgi:hypothetical protein